MSRGRPNVEWQITPATGAVATDNAQLAVLMDIREELRTLNRLLHCDNFQKIPRTLKRISANTAKPRKSRT